MSIKVCFPNYLNSGEYADITASSSATGFPVSNLDGTVRRSKVWQSAGQFIVTSSNNVIRFRDASGGADKDATIAAGTYTTIATFLAAVDAALEAAGSANYTVTQNSTSKKIVLTSDLSGGASAFELRCADAAFTARDLLGFAASNTSGASTYTADNVRIHTEESITIDLGSSFNPKVFAVFGPRNEPIRISSTATITLMGNSTNVWTSPAFTQTLTWNEFAIIAQSTTGLHSSALRYWRLTIVDRDNVRGYIEISSILLGDTLTFTQGAPQFPMILREIEQTQQQKTGSGSTWAAMLGRTSELDLDWQFMTKAEIEQWRDLYDDRGIGYPFHVFLDPNEVFSTDQERYCLQVLFTDALSFQLDGPNRFSSNMTLVEDV